jgi:hypothetical protein
MSFQYPALVWLLVPLLLLFLISFVRSKDAESSRAVANHLLGVVLILRAILSACIVLALAAPFSAKERPLEAIVALLDISASITERQGEELLDKSRALAERLSVPLSVVPFAESVVPRAIRLSAADSYKSIRTAWQH